MKSKTGTRFLCLFLFSISLCLRLFSQTTSDKVNYLLLFSDKKQPLFVLNFGNNISSITPIESVLFKKGLSLIDTTGKKDRDSDGIIDSLDKCPDQKGVIQYDGCPFPDSDNDGIADNLDSCPSVRGLAKYHGCPPPDTDGDKITDDEDKCPLIPGVARYDGCLVGDKDGDGVNDDNDKCREIRGTAANQGCPENKGSGAPRKDKLR